MEQADKIHGERIDASGYGSKAIDSMAQFFQSGPCYVATSWGKDSTVLAHLLALSGLNIPLVNIAQHGPQSDPYCADVRDRFLARFSVQYHEIAIDADNSRQKENQKAPGLVEGIKIVYSKFGTSRYIGGVRASESGVRKIHFRSRGITCQSSCHPIAWWSEEDIFGWLTYHDLPVHPAYAMTGGGRWDRRKIRVSILAGAKGNQFGRREWEQEYYGDILRRIQSGR